MVILQFLFLDPFPDHPRDQKKNGDNAQPRPRHAKGKPETQQKNVVHIPSIFCVKKYYLIVAIPEREIRAISFLTKKAAPPSVKRS
jgi:hypothetical protein